jgi:hypothetical protein
MIEIGTILAIGPDLGDGIPAWIETIDRVFHYDRAWAEDAGLEQLAVDEIVIAPGLIYKLCQGAG